MSFYELSLVLQKHFRKFVVFSVNIFIIFETKLLVCTVEQQRQAEKVLPHLETMLKFAYLLVIFSACGWRPFPCCL